MSGTWTIEMPKWLWLSWMVGIVLMWLAILIDVLGWLA